MKIIHLLLTVLILISITLNSCGMFLSEDQLVEKAANFVINKYQQATCEEIAKMHPSAKDTVEEDNKMNKMIKNRAIEILKNNPEMRKKFINQVAGPIANKMFECDILP